MNNRFLASGILAGASGDRALAVLYRLGSQRHGWALNQKSKKPSTLVERVDPLKIIVGKNIFFPVIQVGSNFSLLRPEGF